MSKKNKVSSAKGKAVAKAKKATKPVKKAKQVSKPAAKKAASKPVKVKAKASKPAVKKIAKAKPAKPVKKAAKPVKKASSPIKPIKVAAKKPVKKAIKASTAKVKPSAAKKGLKPPLKKSAPVKPAVAKKIAKAPAVKPVKKSVPAGKSLPGKKEQKPALKKEVVVKPQAVKPVKAEETKPKAQPKAEPAVTDVSKKEEVLAIMNTIPKEKVQELPASKIASITSSITNPVKKEGAYAVKVEKEPNGKFEMEFPFRASPEMLYEFFSTPSGLSEWFCDDVNIRNGIYTFIWDGQMQQARLLKTIESQLARYQWVDKNDGSYFEFRIQRDDLTNDISLIVTDFADTKSEQESSKLLWNSQIEKLMHVIGSIY